MNATKRPRTLLLASRSLPCSSSDAATTLPDAAVACRINADQSLATPPRHERHQKRHEPCCWPAAACHARARTPPPRCRTPL
ncbi:hypothetical protein PF003_g35204 [Phytophthora fragariae]|nr:hypothetical protein PF003_g35204 [Phytophthora fragariae]